MYFAEDWRRGNNSALDTCLVLRMLQRWASQICKWTSPLPGWTSSYPTLVLLCASPPDTNQAANMMPVRKLMPKKVLQHDVGATAFLLVMGGQTEWNQSKGYIDMEMIDRNTDTGKMIQAYTNMS